MDEDLFIHFPFNLYSASAVSAARRYVTLIEAQRSQAYTDERAGALAHYHSLPNRDEGDYEAYVRAVERDYEDEFRPILRFTSVVYLYIVFETHVSRHVSEIQRILQGDPVILKDLKAKNKCGIIEAAKIYFRDHANLIFFADEQWLQLNEIAGVRHCIVHDAGIPRDSKHRDTIYALETRKWQGRPVGLRIDRYQALENRLLAPLTDKCGDPKEPFHRIGLAGESRQGQDTRQNRSVLI